jgi:hypothetical protein
VRNRIQIVRESIWDFWENLFRFDPPLMAIGILETFIRIIMNYLGVSTIERNRGFGTHGH